MELVSFSLPKSLKKLVIAPIGDIQWSGESGPTAQDHLKRHIDQALSLDAYFCGLGDVIDFMSPSNRQRLMSAALYDTAKGVIWEKAMELTTEVYEKFLKPTTGRWLGLVEGHHFYEAEGETTDEHLARMLKTEFLGTSAFLHNPASDFTMYLHHGTGGGQLPGAALNKAYHVAAGLQGAEVYLFGHSTKLATARLSRPFPVWGRKQSEHRLEHRDIFLLSCGSFSKSNIVGHRHGSIKRGDYAEQGLMTPSPLTAPFITVDLSIKDRTHRTRVSI